MKTEIEAQETLLEIRQMMERSCRFLSLNGLSGVFAGIIALVGAYIAYWHLQNSELQNNVHYNLSDILFFIVDAALVLIVSLSIAIYLSYRKARKHGIKLWDKTAKKVIINLLIPLITGGIMCFVLLYHGHAGIIASIMLIFYGLALINASHYTFTDIRYLGIIELIIGLFAAFFIGYGILFWALGFGLAHIVYGSAMYLKYEK